MTATGPTVAVIGLGAMGGAAARRLLATGHDVVVWNRSPERAEPLLATGAAAAESPADAARRAQVVLTFLAHPDALREVTGGPDGLVAGVSRDTTVIEMSTVGPAAITSLVDALPERSLVLDAPVLGSSSETEGGKLEVFAGGPDELVRRWTPLLETFGSVLHVGPLGSGAAAKLVANSTLFSTVGMLGEALALADGLGLSRDAAFAVLSGTPVGAQSERRRSAIQAREYPRRFSLRLGVKDATLVTDAARQAGVDLRLADAARSWLEDADTAGFSELDYSAVIAFILGEQPS